MKKAVLAVTALLATMTAAPAMAAEFSYGGFMRYRGIWIDPGTANAIWGGTASETNDVWEYRIRQFFNMKVNDHVTTNVKFEWNSNFGNENALAGGSGDLQFGGPPSTGTSELQFRVKHAYLRFDIPGSPVNITIGQQDFSTPKALISVEDGTGIKAAVKLAPIDLTLFWQKVNNGNFSATATGIQNQTGAEDAHWFGVVPSFKAGDITIAPHVSFLDVGEADNSELFDGALPIAGAEIWYLGVDASGKLGPLGFTADFIYQTGEVGPSGSTVDVASFIFDASVSLTAGPGTLTGKVLYSPGDDLTGTDIDLWVNFLSTDMGWSPFFHDGSSNSGFAGSVTPGLENGGILAVGVEFAFSPVKDFTITPNAYYLMADEDINVAGGAVDDFYGIEAGVQANWKIWDSVNMLFQLDYLFAGDVFENAAGETDDAWRVIIGPSISW